MIPPETNQPQQDNLAGSPNPGEPVFIALGFLRRTHGIHGELVMDVLTSFPERLRPNRPVYLGEEHVPHRLGTVRWADKNMLVTIKGYATPEAAARFRNTYVYVRADALPTLPEGEYYHHQLVGLRVKTEDGQVLGVLEEIIETGANDVYVVRNEGGQETLVPAIKDVVLDVNIEAGEMTVRLQQWE
jgi:16S rRNA processing protein RimM